MGPSVQFYILILGKLTKKCGVMEDDELINNNNNKFPALMCRGFKGNKLKEINYIKNKE